ncbi:class II aldolase/adducin family protein [Bradyrhizobium sp. F1.13.3]|uniref:class II aldolase/adducin family protein n=1 Tax=Bradyrhizobium sp. F1.13.3 TaxID=3156351 RepID=UPI0033940F2F
MTPALNVNKTPISEAEWQTRCDLAALYHVVNYLGWTDTINTHMSARVPDDPGTFLINRYGEMFEEITASSLIKIRLDGDMVGEPGKFDQDYYVGERGKFNRAGFAIHSSVYNARQDANCVMHTHTRAGAGVSLMAKGLRPISQDVMEVIDDVVYHHYGIPSSDDECEALGKSCAAGSCVVLLNHGLLTHGPTIHGALQRLYMLERACELELIARQLDEPPVLMDDAVIARAAHRMKTIRNTRNYGLLEWEGLVRTVERRGVDFRR